VRRQIIFASGILVLLGWAGVYFAEPRADGKPLSEWLRVLNIPEIDVDPQQHLAASNAVVKIGPRAVPTLLRMLRKTDVEWLEKVEERLPVRFESAYAIQSRAVDGFRVLGPRAKMALPELTQMLFATNFSEQAGMAMGAIGDAAFPALVRAFTNSDAHIRAGGVNGLWQMRPDLMLPVMKAEFANAHGDSYLSFVWLCAHLTGEERFQVWTQALHRPAIARLALFRLSVLGNDAPRALVHVAPLLTNSDPFMRSRATNVFRDIDPVAAAALGINTNPPSRPTNSAGIPRRFRVPN
jgi:hypothetical protein